MRPVPPFRVITADNPWRHKDQLTMKKGKIKRGGASQYDGTIATEDLARLPVRPLAAEDCVLGLWVPDAMLRDGEDVLDAWGFRYVQKWIWVKTGKYEDRTEDEEIPEDMKMAFPMGRLSRVCTETLLIGVRGNVYQHLQSKNERNVFFAPITKHSKKPEKVQNALDRMFPKSPKLELFARRQRRNWRCIGNQAPETKGEDIRVSLARLCGVELPPDDPDQIPLWTPGSDPATPATP